MITCEAGRASEPSISSETGESSVSGESGGACIQARSSNRHGKKYEMKKSAKVTKAWTSVSDCWSVAHCTCETGEACGSSESGEPSKASVSCEAGKTCTI